MDDIDVLSSTDVKCIWANKRKYVEEMFLAVPVSDFCHVKFEENENLQNLDTSKTLGRLLAACPNSSLAKCLMLRKSSEQINPVSTKRKENDEPCNIRASPKRYYIIY